MRVDFPGALMNSDLWPDLEDRFDPLRVAPLRGQALAEAIEAPARALGVAFEPRLAERLVADAADEPGALPLLQETLRLLWAERAGEGVRDPRTAYIDLAHEALIEGWPALARWLGELQGAEQTRRRLESKVDEWRRLGRGQGGLLDAEELPEFDAWRKSKVALELGIDPDLSALVERSRAALTRRRRVRNGAVASLLTLVAVASVLFGALLQQQARAEEERRAAEKRYPHKPAPLPARRAR